MGDGAHFEVFAIISGIRPNWSLPQGGTNHSPSNEKSGNKFGNFHTARYRGLNLGKEKAHIVIDIETFIWFRGRL
jgi:hypothetical protein